MILFIAVLPLMLINIRNIRRAGARRMSAGAGSPGVGPRQPYRSVFVRRLPLRIAVIAICVVWFAAHAGPAS